jgi:hypothetical protein
MGPRVRERRADTSSLLRWYPREWRERYGDEFAALMEDSLNGARPTLRFRLSIVGAGLRERGHQGGLLGEGSAAGDRVRAGSLLVLCAWAVFVVAGASFSKLSEQFDSAVPAASRSLPWGAFKTIQMVAVVAGILVGVGALAAVPACLRFLRDGGWRAARRHVRRATAVTTVTVVASIGLVAWANSLSYAQRNGGSSLYGLAFLVWAVLIATTLALWTVVAVALGRRLVLARSLLAFEALLATAVTAAMIAIAAATAIWWAAIAVDAPWFLHGTASGTPGSAFEPRLAVTMALMLSAVIAAGYGVARIMRSWGQLRAA